MIAGNSGRPGGAIGNPDGSVGQLHASYSTQEEDVVSNWLITMCRRHKKSVGGPFAAEHYRQTIHNVWGMRVSASLVSWQMFARHMLHSALPSPDLRRRSAGHLPPRDVTCSVCWLRLTINTIDSSLPRPALARTVACMRRLAVRLHVLTRFPPDCPAVP